MSPCLTLSLLVLAQLEINAAPVTVADSSHPASRYRQIALMPLTSLGSTDEAVNAIQAILVGEFTKVLGERLIAPDALLEQSKHVKSAFYSCEGVVVCLTEVMGGLGWDAFVVGNIAGLGERQVINLKLIDVRTGREVAKASEKAVGEQSELITYMRKAAVQLVAPDLFTGTLVLAAAQPGVQVQLDGQLLGTVPLANNRFAVPVGQHALEASGEGLVPFTTMVELAYGETKTVTVDLPRSTAFVGGDTPFRHRWWTWAIAGAGALAVGLGGYFNALHVDTVEKIEKRARSGTLTAQDVDLFTEQEAHWNRSVVLYGSGGGLLLGVGVLFALDFL